METNWGVILRRSGKAVLALTLACAVWLALHPQPAGCTESDLALQTMLGGDEAFAEAYAAAERAALCAEEEECLADDAGATAADAAGTDGSAACLASAGPALPADAAENGSADADGGTLSVDGGGTSSPQSAPAERVVYLSFDDGPSPTTAAILDVLKAEGVPATFFVIAADNNRKYLPLLARTVADGHAVGLHSCSHEYRDIYKSPEAFWQDIAALREAITPYGCGGTMLLRFPGGSTNTVSRRYGGHDIMQTLKEQAKERGYRYFDWNVCGGDAVGGHPDAQTIYENVVREADGHARCTVLLHDTAATRSTAAALPDIIRWFQNAGYRFDTLDNRP